MTPDEATLRDLILHDTEILRQRSFKDTMQTGQTHTGYKPQEAQSQSQTLISAIEAYRELKKQRLQRESLVT